ncbi:hypothetical protein OE749_09935 [Aestuariibacter sp. AA17]|uniref:CheR-type methyltransferase domain-containing protein n=1 Tax=Fluctibacter corallii TaxID=2984329 RepID=A0ABT3A9M5_9ALTE|nr:CheR family methyltransferase [Aestuariibacter sp. AA17]MCV2885016.1 hypothetical protein [Aestuariibacter sp. AA17]
MDKDELLCELILHVIKRQCQHDFTLYALPVLQKRIQRFIETQGLASHETLLLALIKGDKKLEYDLVQALTVHYTHFFRNKEYFQLFYSEILPHFAHTANFRLWSIGCSSGEEVYSYAMLIALRNQLAEAALIGTDLNANQIDIASAGVYPLNKLEELESGFKSLALPANSSLLSLIDSQQKSTFTFCEAIRQSCHFSTHDMTRDASLGAVHVISCRNTLMYFSEEKQQEVINQLILPSLVPGGYVITGEAENLEPWSDTFNLKRLHNGINIYHYHA